MAEQHLIARYFSHHRSGANVNIGIGDDAAIVTPPKNSKLVVTTDTLNEGTHFHVDCNPEHLGHKALAVSLSDLAAMGAVPLWSTINLSIPKTEHAWLEKFTRGFFALANRHAIKVIGGDLVKGPLSIATQTIGYLNSAKVLARSNAEVGDLIYVSGSIGDAALGLKLHGRVHDLGMSSSDHDYFASRFNKPEPRVTLGMEIVEFAGAAIDVSDGLLIDLQRILTMSAVGAIINIERIPLSQPMRRRFKTLPDWPMPLTGGEDYELIFTADRKRTDKIHNVSSKNNCPITVIGKIVKDAGIQLLKDGNPFALPDTLGFDHFG